MSRFEVITGHAFRKAAMGDGWEARLLRTDKGKLQAKSFNARLILENHDAWQGVLAYDEMSHCVVKLKDPPLPNAARGEWEDADDAELRHWLAENYGIEPRGGDLADAVMTVARGAKFHPIRSYLDSLEWDGVDRLATWLKVYCGSGLVLCDGVYQDADESKQEARDEAEYYALVGTKFLIGAVARVRNPGCKMDNVLILEGAQGSKKSTVLKVLFGDDWFSDSPLRIGDKDSMETLRGLWLVELAELDSFNKAESTTAKSFFSSASDRYRTPYGHRSTRYPRQCLFAGTTNQHVYLRDLTGNRRYWPVSCTEIDIECLREMRDQLWAEADHRYANGETWWPEDDQRRLFEAQQGEREDEDVWASLIAEWVDEKVKTHRAVAPEDVTLHVTMAEIMAGALGMDKHAMKRPEQTRVGMIMHALGWRYTRRVVGGRRVGGYRQGIELYREQEANDDHPF